MDSDMKHQTVKTKGSVHGSVLWCTMLYMQLEVEIKAVWPPKEAPLKVARIKYSNHNVDDDSDNNNNNNNNSNSKKR